MCYICYNWNIGVELGKPLQSWIDPKYAGIHTKSMGKVGPNNWSSNQIIFRTDLVTHEDKTMNHTDHTRTQTWVILVTKNCVPILGPHAWWWTRVTHVGGSVQDCICFHFTISLVTAFVTSTNHGELKFIWITQELAWIGMQHQCHDWHSTARWRTGVRAHIGHH